MIKVEGLLYPTATALFVLNALFVTLFFPILGGISGFVTLYLLTIKYFIGKKREKLMDKLPDLEDFKKPNNEPQKKGVAKSGGGSKPKTGGASSKLSGAAKGNIYVLIIDYLTSPMNRFEKGILIFGWALWPIFFPLMIIIIIMTVEEFCKYLGFNWCSILASFK